MAPLIVTVLPTGGNVVEHDAQVTEIVGLVYVIAVIAMGPVVDGALTVFGQPVVPKVVPENVVPAYAKLFAVYASPAWVVAVPRINCTAAPPTFALNVKALGATRQFVRGEPARLPDSAPHAAVAGVKEVPTTIWLFAGVAHTKYTVARFTGLPLTVIAHDPVDARMTNDVPGYNP